jgi:hypothetical protein
MLSIAVKIVPTKPIRRAITEDREQRMAIIAIRGTRVNVVSSGKAADSDQGVKVISISDSKYNQKDY